MNTSSRTLQRYGILSAVLVSLLISCSQEEAVFTPAPYHVNVDLTTAPITVDRIGLSLALPLGPKAMDEASLDVFRQMLGSTAMSQRFYPVFPLNVLVDSASGMMIHISAVDERQAPLADVAAKYEDFILPRLKGTGLGKNTYSVNDVRFYLYLVHSTQIVNFKLLGETAGGERFLIEYIIPAPIYPDWEPAVTASMASMVSVSSSGQ